MSTQPTNPFKQTPGAPASGGCYNAGTGGNNSGAAKEAQIEQLRTPQVGTFIWREKTDVGIPPKPTGTP